MDNLCLKCGGLYFRDEKNTRGIYTHCCHNGNIIEQASVYPVEMKGLMDGSDELSVHFKNNIRSYQCFNGRTDCTVYRERSVLLQNSWPNHRTSHLHPTEAGGENTNTTHFNNIITHIRHVSRDLRPQRRAAQVREGRLIRSLAVQRDLQGVLVRRQEGDRAGATLQRRPLLRLNTALEDDLQ
ncbi:hypothetical protein AVEN_73510-1 [Araneus ventricosus]|uniref:Uncharacterized protein n=1 Tax=Araneus ventricosus TaxID=182803 RepID=A0A4Y2IG19_ARAVE|nr:hypothetical protein AVEN_73510-1 [Araneus ventricosus]